MDTFPPGQPFHISRYGRRALVVAYSGEWTAEKAAAAYANANRALNRPDLRPEERHLPRIADSSWKAFGIEVEASSVGSPPYEDWSRVTSAAQRPWTPSVRYRLTHAGSSHPCEDFSSMTFVDLRIKEPA